MKNNDLNKSYKYDTHKDKIVLLDKKTADKEPKQAPDQTSNCKELEKMDKTYKKGFMTMSIIAFVLFVLGIVSFSYLIVTKTAPVMYEVMYRNNTGDDVETLETYKVAKGSTKIPDYQGSEPYRLANASYTYKFTGWEQHGVLPVSANIEMLATYEKISQPLEANYWSVTWLGYNDKGNTEVLLSQDDIKDGDMVAWTGAEPTRPENSDYEYEFTGWLPSIDQPIHANMTFRAQFAAKEKVKPAPDPLKYEVIWKDEIDEKRLWDKQYVEAGQIPQYQGEEPTAISRPGKRYEFVGWDKEMTAIHADTTYIAKYRVTDDKNQYAFNDKTKTYALTGSTAANITNVVALFDDGINGPERVTAIGTGSDILSMLEDFATIEIPPHIEEISDYAFNNQYDMYNFQVIFLDKENSKLTKIGKYAFEEYPQESIDLPDSVEIVGEGVFKDAKITSFRCPDNLKIISKDMFFRSDPRRRGYVFNKLTIGRKVEKIEAFAFTMVPDTFNTLFIPKNVKEIDKYGFWIGMDGYDNSGREYNYTIRCEPSSRLAGWNADDDKLGGVIGGPRWKDGQYRNGSDLLTTTYLWNQVE